MLINKTIRIHVIVERYFDAIKKKKYIYIHICMKKNCTYFREISLCRDRARKIVTRRKRRVNERRDPLSSNSTSRKSVRHNLNLDARFRGPIRSRVTAASDRRSVESNRDRRREVGGGGRERSKSEISVRGRDTFDKVGSRDYSKLTLESRGSVGGPLGSSPSPSRT